MSDLEKLHRALRDARRRLEDALPYSPEWQAAIEAVEELRRRIDEVIAVPISA